MSATDLATRIALHTPGQITWPEPALQKTCADCDHFDTHNVKTAGGGRCDLVLRHQSVSGKIFIGAMATACTQFRKVK